MEDLMKLFREACEHYGILFKVGWLKDLPAFSQGDVAYPYLWVVYPDIKVNLIDSPFITHTIEGFLIINKKSDETDLYEYDAIADLFVSWIKFVNYNNDLYEFANIEGDVIPESLIDRGYGVKFKFDVEYRTEPEC